jgi:beta-lactamase class A
VGDLVPIASRIERLPISVSVFAAALVMCACVPVGQPAEKIPSAATAQAASTLRAPSRETGAARRLRLAARIASLGQGFDGNVGISVRDVADGWTTGFAISAPRPQQSVSKLWVALALLDAVDHGTVSLGEAIVVLPSDLTLFHQPIRDLVGPSGYRTTVGEALTRSDNTANDVLLRHIGGPSSVKASIAAKGLAGIGFGPGERPLQSATAGLAWTQDYAREDAFFAAREALPMATRTRALERYLANPPDGASAGGITNALLRLERGELLSPGSTALLLSLMGESLTGPERVRGGLSPGWSFAHKTGTGQELDGLATGYNDVGLLTAPSGHRYAVAVMIAAE